MAKVKGPLLSLRASGQIGNAEVYASWRGVPYVRMYVVPANPRTVGQLNTRSVFTWLNSVFRQLGAIGQYPWLLAATGRPLTDRNMLIKTNLPALIAETTLANFMASPGAKGGPAMATFAAVAGGAAGEIDWTITAGDLPTGWTVHSGNVMAVADQDPHGIFDGEYVEQAVVAPGPYTGTLTVDGAGADYAVSGWIRYTKPDGSFAVSVSDTIIATSGV